MNRLFICNTYYQLIVATHMSLSIFKEDMSDVVITDQSRNSESLHKNMLTTNGSPFRNIFYVRDKQYCIPGNGIDFLKDIHNSLFDKSLFGVIGSRVYDEVLAFNFDFALFALYNRLSDNGRHTTLSKYEEGISGYNHVFDYPKMKVVRGIRKLFLRRNLDFEKFYCFFPEVYRGSMSTTEIPSISEDKQEIASLLQGWFDINIEKDDYKAKYIFFTSVYDFEGGKPIGEFEAVKKIASRVGKENILIKKHPRDPRTVFENAGFQVDKNSSIPWEALQFYIDLSGKTLLTVNSGAVISTSLLFGSSVQSYYVYPLCDISENSLAAESVAELQKLLHSDFIKNKTPNVKILQDVNELA